MAPARRRRLSWKHWGAVLAAALLLPLALPALAGAHVLPASKVLLEVGSTNVTGEVQLPLGRLSVALGRTLTAATAAEQHLQLERYIRSHISATSDDGSWQVTVTNGHIETMNGRAYFVATITLTPPDGQVTDFDLHYAVIIAKLVTHRAFLVLTPTSSTSSTSSEAIGIFDWTTSTIYVPVGSVSPFSAFTSMAHLGVQHISEGADHLLFLITLLIPAPLLIRARRWGPAPSPFRAARRIVHVVTAFAIGHSITLALAGFGLVNPPAQPIEVLIALSIAVSALHAIRPIVRGGEAMIALCFGLVHGLAFAEVLRGLGLQGTDLVVSLLGFNLGIEVTQLLVVALLMPSFWLLSRTGIYPAVRVGIGAAAFVAAVAWMLERANVIATDPLDPVTEGLISHPFVVATGLAIAAVTSSAISRRSERRGRLAHDSAALAAGAARAAR